VTLSKSAASFPATPACMPAMIIHVAPLTFIFVYITELKRLESITKPWYISRKRVFTPAVARYLSNICFGPAFENVTE
jgi:hypothetical protein